MSQQLAIDVGATGIKGAIVDTQSGDMVADRIKYPTPADAKASNIIPVINQLVNDFNWSQNDIGIGFPSIVKNNICGSANNIDPSWINLNIAEEVKKITGKISHILNDADAAGLAEIHFGKGANVKGTVIMLTLGTGIGSGMFKDGNLLANVELGSLQYKDGISEDYASNKARKTKDLSWEQFGHELNEFLIYVNRIFSPDLMIIGGGISKKYEKYSGFINSNLNVTKADLQNNAGIIGAAMYAQNMKSND